MSLNWKKNSGNLTAVAFVHLACLGAFWTEVNTTLIVLCAASFFIRMFGITGGYHRYFSHKTYKAGRLMQFAIGWLGCSAAQKGPLWWAAHHRAHHLEADTRNDIHSPIRESFFYAHMEWWLGDKYDETDYKRIPDLAKYPELVWMNKYFLVPPIVWGGLCALIAGWPGLLWGFFISTTLLWHGTFLINSAAHVFGKRRFPTRDSSRNSLTLALITLGEGWHNNHHYYPASTKQGFYWWEIDITYYGLKFLSAVGLVSDLRQPPEAILALGRLNDRNL